MMWASNINEAVIEELDYLDLDKDPKICDEYREVMNSNSF